MDPKNLVKARKEAEAQLNTMYDEAQGRALTADEQVKEAALNDAIESRQRQIDLLAANAMRAQTDTGLLDAAEGAAAEARAAAEASAAVGDELTEEEQLIEMLAARSVHNAAVKVAAEFTGNLEARSPMGTSNPNPPVLEAQAFALPEATLSRQLYKYAIDRSPLLSLVRKIRTTTGEELKLPRLTNRPTSVWMSEGETFTESNIAGDQFSLNAHKLGHYSALTYELLRESIFDIRGELINLGSEALSRGLEAAVSSGDGTGKPHGALVQYTTVTANTYSLAAADADRADALIDWTRALSASYGRNQVLVVGRELLTDMRKLRGSDGHSLWRASEAAGMPDTFNGTPVIEDPTMAALVAGNTVGIAFDPSTYVLRYVDRVRIERNDSLGWLEDVSMFKFVAYADGDVQDLNGGVMLDAVA